MSKTGIERSLRLLWVVGNCLWCSMIPLMWWHAYEAQTSAQASLSIPWLGTAAGIGAVWSIAGAVWLAKRRNGVKDAKG